MADHVPKLCCEVRIFKHASMFSMTVWLSVFRGFVLCSIYFYTLASQDSQVAVCQNRVPLVNIKIAGKWMFIPLKMVLIDIDPYPSISMTGRTYRTSGCSDLSSEAGATLAVSWSQVNPGFVSQGASLEATLDHKVIATQLVPEAIGKGHCGGRALWRLVWFVTGSNSVSRNFIQSIPGSSTFFYFFSHCFPVSPAVTLVLSQDVCTTSVEAVPVLPGWRSLRMFFFLTQDAEILAEKRMQKSGFYHKKHWFHENWSEGGRKTKENEISLPPKSPPKKLPTTAKLAVWWIFKVNPWVVSRPGTSLKQFKTPPGHWNWRVPAASDAKNVHQDDWPQNWLAQYYKFIKGQST